MATSAAACAPRRAGLRGERCSCCTLLRWENPVTSSAVFVSVNLLYFFVFALNKSCVSLLCYFLLVPFALGLLFKALDLAPAAAAAAASRTRQQQQQLEEEETGEEFSLSAAAAALEAPVEVVSRETVEESIRSLYETINAALAAIRDVILWKNPTLSLKCAVLVWATGYCASFFSLSFLFFLLFWVAFGFSFLKRICYDGFFLPLLAPQLRKATKKAQQIINAIPKMKDVSSDTLRCKQHQ